MNNTKIQALISLLDDEDPTIASKSIAELVSYGKDIEPYLADLQEDSNALIRKRVHQIQAILKIRKSRDLLRQRFNKKKTDLWLGLIEIHLLWFDHENDEEITSSFDTILKKFKTIKSINASSISAFMKSQKFITPVSGDVDADFCCLGSALDNKIGFDFIICAIMLKLIEACKNKAGIVMKDNKFFVLYDDKIIDPASWQLYQYDKNSYKLCNSGALLRHATMQLFLSAVASDSYRYIYSIGSCLSENDGEDFVKQIFG